MAGYNEGRATFVMPKLNALAFTGPVEMLPLELHLIYSICPYVEFRFACNGVGVFLHLAKTAASINRSRTQSCGGRPTWEHLSHRSRPTHYLSSASESVIYEDDLLFVCGTNIEYTASRFCALVCSVWLISVLSLISLPRYQSCH